jgi:DNA modification methylase
MSLPNKTSLLHGDCLEVLRTMPDNSVDSIVTDPPYGLTTNKKGGTGLASVNLENPYGRSRIGTGNGSGGFMGLKWDSDVPPVDVWAECLRVLKPGGHLLAFAGTRTQHRMAVRIEDAGFEIRDMIAWVYGSGFPKSLDVSKAIDKAAGAEREVVGSKLGQAGYSLAEHKGREVYAGDWTDPAAECTITAPATPEAQQWSGWGTALKPALEPITVARKPLVGTVAANVLEHGTGALNIDGCRVAGEVPVFSHKGQNAANCYADGLHGSARTGDVSTQGRWPANLIHDGSDEVLAGFPATTSGGGPKPGTPRTKANTYGEPTVSESAAYGSNTGSAARFFYCAKASKTDRGAENIHPTVKPTDLMRYLCRLVTPPGGVVLDPFMGSGSTGKAAILEGFRFIGIERETAYIEIAQARIDSVVQPTKQDKSSALQHDLFKMELAA